MQEWQAEWQGLKEQILTLQGDCADFGLPAPELAHIAEVEEDLNKQQAGL